MQNIYPIKHFTDVELASMQCSRAWLEINLDRLAHNVRQMKRLLSPSADLIAVVKADAYGHGSVRTAEVVVQHGATCLAVATVSEGIELRKAGIKAPILLLGATNTAEQFQVVIDWQIQPTLCTFHQALLLSESLASSLQEISVHINVDTGMSRLGIPWQQAVEFVRFVECLPHLKVASVYSHLATADELNSDFMYLQQNRYNSVLAQLQSEGISTPKRHLANSAATLLNNSFHYDLVRVGLALYGLSPAPHFSNRVDLKPVLHLKARITQIKTIQPGASVSYGRHYVASKETRIAVVAVGYADGVPRRLSNRMEVLFRGERVPQIGIITMDQLMLDISDFPDASEGEIVTLLGQQQNCAISVEEWANSLGTISWEILCGFKDRLPRVSIGQPLSSESRENEENIARIA